MTYPSVTLSPDQTDQALASACEIWVAAVKRAREDTGAFSAARLSADSLEAEVRGQGGELAVAEYFGVPWRPSHFRDTPDVMLPGGLATEVKAAAWGYDLRIKPNDFRKDGRPWDAYVLVWGQVPTFALAGWLPGKEVRSYVDNPDGLVRLGKAVCIPYQKLRRPMSDLTLASLVAQP